MNKWITRLDWKYFLMLMVTLASSYSVLLPYFQSPEREFSISLVSQAALQPDATKDKNMGLEITIDKIPVKDPYLTTYKIENTGRTPILAKDFENALEISTNKNKSIIRVEISDKSPQNLRPNIHKENELILVDPLLLNSNDSITLSILSANGIPKFNFSARIAGIQSINTIIKSQNKSPSVTWILSILTILLILLAGALAWRTETTKNKVIEINRVTAVLTYFSVFYVSLMSLGFLLMLLNYWSLINLILAYLISLIIIFPFSKLLEKRQPMQITDIKDKN